MNMETRNRQPAISPANDSHGDNIHPKAARKADRDSANKYMSIIK
jgi:hypothetical protein